MSTKSNVSAMPSKEDILWQQDCVQNVKVTTTKNKLIIEVDLTKTLGPSASGKTHTVGSTQGFLALPSHPGVGISLNVNRKQPK